MNPVRQMKWSVLLVVQCLSTSDSSTVSSSLVHVKLEKSPETCINKIISTNQF